MKWELDPEMGMAGRQRLAQADTFIGIGGVDTVENGPLTRALSEFLKNDHRGMGLKPPKHAFLLRGFGPAVAQIEQALGERMQRFSSGELPSITYYDKADGVEKLARDAQMW